jgi:transglutaminase-like putative cysteine protease
MVPVSTLITVLAYAVAILGYLPVAPHVDLAVRLVFPLALVAGIVFDRKGRYPLAGIPSTIATIIPFVVYFLQLSMANPAAPVVNFLVVLLSVRMVNEKSPRNLLQTFALALFALASSSLFSLSALFLVYLFLQLALIAVSLVLLTFLSVDGRLRLTRQSLSRVVGVALAMPAASVPLLLIFFAILPRTQYPLLNFLNVPGERATGFSDRVEPGKASSVGDVKTVAFRAECPQLGRNDLYWRGIVFDSLAGATWVRSGKRPDEVPATPKGNVVRQVIYPEPSRNAYLLALDIPTRLDGVRVSQDTDFTFTRSVSGSGRIRYEANSVLSDAIPVPQGIDRDHYLRLPDQVSPRIAALARGFTAGSPTDTERFSRVETWFTQQGFRYAISGLAVSADPVDAFLFQRRTGHCEFFASSFATLLRLAGVPARLVGGYYGGDYNEIGGYYVVTEDRAHVWVEAFFEGRGWVRVDPSSYAANFDRAGQSPGRGFAIKLASFADSLTWYWNQAVITYDLQKQVEIVRRANRQLRGLNLSFATRWLLPIAGGATACAITVWWFVASGRSTRQERILRRFLARIEKAYGIPRSSPSRGLKELADSVNDPAAIEFATIFGGAIYRDRRLTVEECRQLSLLIDAIGDPSRRAGDKSG